MGGYWKGREDYAVVVLLLYTISSTRVNEKT